MHSCSHDFYNENTSIEDYYSEVQPTWCGGCGNFNIWAALKRALVELDIPPHEVLLAFDIGCNGNMSDKIRGYRIHSLHGRVLPLAAAAKIANPKVKVIAMAGDGATYSEGVNHFVNSIRNNYPMTFIVHDNNNYALTLGEASATTQQGAKRNISPDGPTTSTLNPLELAMSLDPYYVARGFSGNLKELTQIIKDAIIAQERGFAYINVQQACPTFNHETTEEFYMSRVKNVSEYQNYSNTDKTQAIEIGVPWKENIMTGLIYKNEKIPTYLDRLENRKGEWEGSTTKDEVRTYDTEKFFEKSK